MVRRLVICVLITCVHISAGGQDSVPLPRKLSLLFIGDIMGHDEQIKSARNSGGNTYNYDEVFRFIKPVISEPDIAIANLEVTLGGPPYKGYPRFSSPAALAAACKNAGIDCLVTANNHSADRGVEGITGTIKRLDSIGIRHTGTFLNREARDSLYPLVITSSGFSVALLNYTYGLNGLAVPTPVIVNMLNKSLITSDIEKASLTNPDLIILFLHWGTEYDTIPSESQTDLADYFFSLGVDLIIGSHPHVLQKMLWFRGDSAGKDRIVVYSLGNFITNQRKPKTDGGSMVRIDLMRNRDSIRISSAGYYLTWVYTPIEGTTKRFYILPCSEFEDKPDFFADPSQYNQMKRFIKSSRALLNKQNSGIDEIVLTGKY